VEKLYVLRVLNYGHKKSRRLWGCGLALKMKPECLLRWVERAGAGEYGLSL